MKQSLVILLVASLFIGCAKHAKTKKVDYDYLFSSGELVPVNTEQEKAKVLNKISISSLGFREKEE